MGQSLPNYALRPLLAEDTPVLAAIFAAHPGAAGQGVASMLCEALEKLAGGRGANSLTVDASDNAQEFFAKRGYVAKQRNTATINGEWLANTTMQKTLANGASPGDSK